MKVIYRDILKDSEPKYSIDENVQNSNLQNDQILIEIKACALSKIDDKVLQHLYKGESASQLPVGQDISGIVRKIGSEVCSLKVGDEIVGVVPLDYGVSGCAEEIILSEYDVVPKPENVSFVDAAACVGDAVRVYTSLHYLAHICSGDTVLVMDGASSFGSLAMQLSLHWGAKVLTTFGSEDENLFLKRTLFESVTAIDVSEKAGNLKQICMQETGNVGVDVVIDNGVSMFSKQDERTIKHSTRLPHKHDIISALAIGGRWVTGQQNLQLDPPDSKLLYMKCATIGYLFEHAWILSSAQQGRYQHILMDIMEKLSDNIISVYIHHTVPFDDVPDEMVRLDDVRVGKVVMKL